MCQVEAGFASKAERRLASRLHNLLEASVPHQPEEPPAGDENLKPMIPQSDSPSTKASKVSQTRSSATQVLPYLKFFDVFPVQSLAGMHQVVEITVRLKEISIVSCCGPS